MCMVRRDVYAALKTGNLSRQLTHIAPITSDCLCCDGRDMSQHRHLGGVWWAGVT